MSRVVVPEQQPRAREEPVRAMGGGDSRSVTQRLELRAAREHLDCSPKRSPGPERPS